MKAAEWNPELSSKYETFRAIGRPRRRWEDEINEFLKLEEAEISTENDTKCNSSWIKAAKDRGRFIILENEYTMTTEKRYEINLLRRGRPSKPISEIHEWSGGGRR